MFRPHDQTWRKVVPEDGFSVSSATGFRLSESELQLADFQDFRQRAPYIATISLASHAFASCLARVGHAVSMKTIRKPMNTYGNCLLPPACWAPQTDGNHTKTPETSMICFLPPHVFASCLPHIGHPRSRKTARKRRGNW
jgi:hypothetical protein